MAEYNGFAPLDDEDPRRKVPPSLAHLYGMNYVSPAGQDAREIVSTDPRRMQTLAQPKPLLPYNDAAKAGGLGGFVDWAKGLSAPAGNNNTGIAGAMLGRVGRDMQLATGASTNPLDADGRRVNTPLMSAAAHTIGNLTPPKMIEAVTDTAGGLMDRSKAFAAGIVPPQTDNMAGPLGLMTAAMAPIAAAGAGALTGQAAIESNAAGVFGGRLAKTADHAKRAQAEDMTRVGLSRDQVWRDTGWFQHPPKNGQWWHEIPDGDWNVRTPHDVTTGTVKDFIDLGRTGDAYPGLYDLPMKTGLSADKTTWRGAYLPSEVTAIAGHPEQVRSASLHEIGGHGVQSAEGVAPGTNPLREWVKRPWIGREGAQQRYMDHPSEQLSRAIEARAMMPDGQRKARPPWLDFNELPPYAKGGANTPIVASERPAQPASSKAVEVSPAGIEVMPERKALDEYLSSLGLNKPAADNFIEGLKGKRNLPNEADAKSVDGVLSSIRDMMGRESDVLDGYISKAQRLNHNGGPPIANWETQHGPMFYSNSDRAALPGTVVQGTHDPARVPVYRGQLNDFPTMRDNPYWTNDPAVASSFANGMEQYKVPGKVQIEGGKTEFYQRDGIKGLLDKITGKQHSRNVPWEVDGHHSHMRRITDGALVYPGVMDTTGFEHIHWPKAGEEVNPSGSMRWDWDMTKAVDEAQARGSPGIAFHNVIEDRHPNVHTQYVPVKRGTVTSSITGETLYSNSGRAALPGTVVQGYRGYNQDHGIGPHPEKKAQAVWGTTNENLAKETASHKSPGIVSDVSFRFENPYIMDGKGGLAGDLENGMIGHIDDLAVSKKNAGHDGLIVKNVVDGDHFGNHIAALQRGTVFDPATGKLLWSNPKEAALPGIAANHGGHRASESDLMTIARLRAHGIFP